jgi:hypothetical protein
MSQGILSTFMANRPNLNNVIGGKTGTSGLPGILTGATVQHGTLSTQSAGWFSVTFTKPFTATPSVVAVQGPRGQSVTTLKLTPPTLTPRTISPPTLTLLKSLVPATPQTWGENWKATIAKYCSVTIGNIPVIGGYMCQGINGTFGQLAYYVGNLFQVLWYLGDWTALAGLIKDAVEAKATADINALIGDLQGVINTTVSDINSVIANAVSLEQDAINAVYGLINDAIGLLPGIAIPVTMVRNVTVSGFEIYSPGNNVQIMWIATASERTALP